MYDFVCLQKDSKRIRDVIKPCCTLCSCRWHQNFMCYIEILKQSFISFISINAYWLPSIYKNLSSHSCSFKPKRTRVVGIHGSHFGSPMFFVWAIKFLNECVSFTLTFPLGHTLTCGTAFFCSVFWATNHTSEILGNITDTS